MITKCNLCHGIGTIEKTGWDNTHVYHVPCSMCKGRGFLVSYAGVNRKVASKVEDKDYMIKQSDIDNNKFYIGGNSVFNRGTSGWGHRTLEGAITHAQSMIQLENKDEVFIVQIVKVVRRAMAPIEIVDVK